MFSYGRVISETRKDTSGNVVGSTTYTYDSHGRLASATDSLGRTTSWSYNNADQVLCVTSPAPGNGQTPQVTLTFYDLLGRACGTLLPDGSTTTNFYYPTGLLKQTSGSGSYPVQYSYDAQGRIRTMKTWQDFAADSGWAVTRWNYDRYRGWLVSKDYPDALSGQPPTLEGASGPVYRYSPAGRLLSRTWKRGVTTSYSYTTGGDLEKIDYSDTTPDVTYEYDRRGRRVTAVCNGVTSRWTYNDANLVLTESYSGGTLSALSMSWAYDNKLRLSTVTAKNGSSVIGSAGYGYDAAGRLGTVIEGAFRADYRYEPGSGLLSTVAMTNNGTGVGLVTGRVYDGLGRVSLISSKAYGPQAAGLPLSCGYQYNAANQRTRMVLADGSWWEYRYDRLGQVISGKRYWPDGTPVAGQQFEYAFDDIGNRRSVATGGDRDGSDLRTSTYTVNRLNQYRDRTVPGQVDVLGIADPAAHVTVNGNSAYRKGEYFHHALVVPNSTAQYAEVTVISGAGGGQSRTGKVYFPPATETFSYDADGNLVSDGRWKYSWDGENRLVEMIRDTDNPAGARQRLVFEYDHQGRRIRKQFFTYNGDWQEQSDVVFLYDGWNLVAELDANASNAKVRTYVWGSDLSGSMQGAGGIGGLLKVTQHGSQVTHHFVAYDGNGNVMGLVNTADGSLSARYEYGPFGEPIRISGAISILKAQSDSPPNTQMINPDWCTTGTATTTQAQVDG